MSPRLHSDKCPDRRIRANSLIIAATLAFAASLISANAQAVERDGKEIVEKVCGTCHTAGVNGAPKIGDRDAWIPRLKQGFEVVVRSAIKGHGQMPARGGVADLSDAEMRSAITYMFNPDGAKPKPQSVAAAKQPDPNRKVIGATEIHFGIVTAESIHAMVAGQERKMHGGVPSGAGHYHVNISLFDTKTKVPITNAEVEVKVDDPAMRAETKPLELMGINNTISYGNYFRMPSKGHYTVTVQIRRPGAGPIEVKFDFKA